MPVHPFPYWYTPPKSLIGTPLSPGGLHGGSQKVKYYTPNISNVNGDIDKVKTPNKSFDQALLNKHFTLLIAQSVVEIFQMQ